MGWGDRGHGLYILGVVGCVPVNMLIRWKSVNDQAPKSKI